MEGSFILSIQLTKGTISRIRKIVIRLAQLSFIRPLVQKRFFGIQAGILNQQGRFGNIINLQEQTGWLLAGILPAELLVRIAAVAVAAALTSTKYRPENSYGTAYPRFYRDGLGRTIQAARPTLHACIPVDNSGLSVGHLEDPVRTNSRTHPAATAFVDLKL